MRSPATESRRGVDPQSLDQVRLFHQLVDGSQVTVQQDEEVVADMGQAAIARRVAVWLLFLLSVIAVGVVWMRRGSIVAPYLDAWSQWAAESTVRRPLWGTSMLRWGRVGKLLEFVGGLAVVLDLVKTESLRRFGERASGWWHGHSGDSRLVSLIRTWRLAKRIHATLFDSTSTYVDGKPLTYSYQRREPSPLEEPPAFIDPDELRALQSDLQRLVNAVPPSYDLASRAWRVTYVKIFDFIHDRAPQNRRIRSKIFRRVALLERLVDWNPGILLGLIFFLVLWVPQVIRDAQHPVLAGFAAAALLIIAPLAFFTFDYVLVTIVAAVAWPLSGLVRLVAWLLDRQRPAHILRVLAFICFVVGFQFDLLSS